MVSVLAGLSAGIGSRADPALAAIRDAAPQGEREGRDDAARRSAASPQAAAALSGASPTLRADAVQFLQGLNEDGSGLRNIRRSQSAEGEEPQAQSATGSRGGSAGEEEAASAGARQSDGGKAAGQGGSPAAEEGGGSGGSDASGENLTEEEQKQVKDLQARDREVRAHEQAHARVGGAHAGAPSYTFQQGPDKKRYAIGGEVQIDTSAERTPEATARKMQIVIRAATAPAEPSSQDLRVAQQARATLQEAQAEIRAQSAEELRGGDEAKDAGSADVSSRSAQGGEADSGEQASGRGTPASGEERGSVSGDEGAGDSRRADRASARAAYEQARSLFGAASSSQPGLVA